MAISGVRPDFLLLVVITLAILEGPTAGSVSGFSAGLLFDLLGTGVVGPAALVFAVTGYVAGLMKENLFAEGWAVPVTIVFLGSLLAGAAYAIFLVFVGQESSLGLMLWRIILPGAVYELVLAALTFPWLARVLRSDRSMMTLRGAR